MSSELSFDVAGTTLTCPVVAGYNAGYTGRDQQSVQAHIAELAEQGIGAPDTIPTLFSIPSYMNLQTTRVEVGHPRTSGEVEWALILGGTQHPDLLTVASDHTDRALEAYDVTCAKQISPNVLADRAWRLEDVSADIDDIVLRSQVLHDGGWTVLQEGTIGDLISPLEWKDRLRESGRLQPGVVILGGTLPMIEPDHQFADRWEVSMHRPDGDVISQSYDVHHMVASIT
ncbi:DUF2848 family protein [Aeromicrobium sp. CTD01-1L150]|uniref:DUF2848 family protein n=1 Tax=Aeromicrobium sp. CTD01-1L150 TaxID=3341830 RepID=UPI0035C24C2C